MLDAQWRELCRRCGGLDPARTATAFADRGYMPRMPDGNIGRQRNLPGYKRQRVRVLLPAFLRLGGTFDPDAPEVATNSGHALRVVGGRG